MMFTGLIESTGTVLQIDTSRGGGRLRISTPMARELARGESVSVNGVCLTVVRSTPRYFTVEAVERTLSLTTLGRLSVGDPVNLERALRVGDRLGGHMVTGHVDGVATVRSVSRTENGRDVTLALPETLLRHVAARGSIAVDGVSLTVAEVSGASVTVSLIPETLSRTTVGGLRPGLTVNIETDLAAKYQESIAAGERAPASTEDGLTLERLKELGFTE